MLDTQKTITIFKLLGDETRFQIVKLLLQHDLCVSALACMLNISKPAVSQQLKILREAGLVKGEKRGYWTHYEIEKELLQKTALFLEKMVAQPGRDSYVCLKNKEEKMNPERRVLEMCKNCCEQPEKLKTTPGKCTPEQIKECHDDEKNHPCTDDKREKENQ